MALSWQPILSVDDITQEQWHQLSNDDARYSTPFLSYHFLKGLEKTKCVDGKSGWHSYHIGIFSSIETTTKTDNIFKESTTIEDRIETEKAVLSNNELKLIAFIPCYLKTHSYGEYVFDHAWANAYQHHQVPYYPKLVACIPFTPVTGSRILIDLQGGHTIAELNQFIGLNVDDIVRQASASSFHYLFLAEKQSNMYAEHNLLQRLSVQFVWQNREYKSFEDFMHGMTSRKRRSIRKERMRAYLFPNRPTEAPKNLVSKPSDFCSDELRDALYNEQPDSVTDEMRSSEVNDKAIQINRISGEALDTAVMADFYACYQQTYLKRSGHAGYLNAAFFDYLLCEMRDNIMLVMASHDGKCIASALFFYNEYQLFGRYWGALQEVSGLHFECCYYQGIEFAIENNLQQFNPGTQGEHKILRGFEPTFCYSNHYLQHPDFQAAVADFLQHERNGVTQYKQNGEKILPFKKQ